MIPQIAQFQVRQTQPDAITVLYVKGPGFADSILEGVRREVRDNCKYPLAITFSAVSDIPLERSNKRRFVISEVPF
jgi:phenylacetate-CoA ligase